MNASWLTGADEWHRERIKIMDEVMPRHRYDSEGCCKDCYASKSEEIDPFCDGDDDPGAWIGEEHPAYRPTVAGYLAGIRYMASIGKYWREPY